MAEDNPKTIVYHYIKANGFQVVHGDGVWGGVTSRGYISMSFYSERPAIPRKVVHEVTEANTLGDEVLAEREMKGGVIRQVGVEVLVDLPMAKSLLLWLQEKVDFVEKNLAVQGKGEN